MSKEDGLVTPMRPDGDNSLQEAASDSPSAISIGDNGLPQTDSNSPGQCVTAEPALLHAISKEAELRDVLAEFCCEGSYLIQVGFNQDMLHSNQGLLQEIYLYLESEVHSTQAEKIAGTLDPFPVVIYTPNTTHHYSPSQSEDLWDLWTLRGIFCSEIPKQKAADTLAPSDAGGNSTNPAGTTGFSSASGGTGGHSGDSGAHQDGHDQTGGDSNGSNGQNNGGEDRGDDEDAGNHGHVQVKIHPDRNCSTREISIPFSSTLTLSGEKKQPSTRYRTNACVDIKVSTINCVLSNND